MGKSFAEGPVLGSEKIAKKVKGKGGWGDAARKGGGMEEPSLEALMQAGLISVVCAAIILSNLFIVAAYLMYRGKLLLYVLNIMFMMLTLAVPA